MKISKPSYIRAARALLDWSLQDLSHHCKVHWATLRRIEAGKQKLEMGTMSAIYEALLRGGAKITDKGVEEATQFVATLHDYVDVLQDALLCLNSGDFMWLHCADERRNSPEVTRLFKEIDQKGICLRFLCEKGNSYFTTTPENYRWIDSESFADAPVSTVYADRVVEHVPGNEGDLFIMITCAELASARARQIETAWNRGETPCQKPQGKNTGRT